MRSELFFGLMLALPLIAMTESTKKTNICKDKQETCKAWAERGECENNASYMLMNCNESCEICKISSSYGIEQTLIDSGLSDELALKQVLLKMRTHMVRTERDYPTEWVSRCVNRDELCAMKSAQGQCESNKELMLEYCAPACGLCKDFFDGFSFESVQVNDWTILSENMKTDHSGVTRITNAGSGEVEYVKHGLDMNKNYLHLDIL